MLTIVTVDIVITVDFAIVIDSVIIIQSHICNHVSQRGSYMPSAQQATASLESVYAFRMQKTG
jgi:hypothetical protein